MTQRRWKNTLILALLAPLVVLASQAAVQAYITQPDGAVVPITNRLQQCLDRSGTGETTPGAVDAIEDARILPEAYRPVEKPLGSGNYPVTFKALGEGAGYRNSFGYFYIDDDPTDPANLRTVFNCRPNDSQCACPCNPNSMRPGGTSEVTINFENETGFQPGRAIGFWLRTPEKVDGSGNDPDNCGNQNDTQNRIYFTSKSLNDDGDFVHFLVYESQTFENSYYFGFEDLFRGGDNDYEDMLVRASGLVPICTPQPETCNDQDDDCDLKIDENVTRACSTACGNGAESCEGGIFGACSAPTPGTEVCDGKDNNCNGQADEGLSRGCSTACGAGVEICVSGTYVDCTAPSVSTEVCNGLDDDCDGKVDEDITRVCSTGCGQGEERCEMGAFVGCTAPPASEEVCNNLDDDCDGIIDDGNPGGGARCVPDGDGYRVIGEDEDPEQACSPGTVQCVGGELSCVGSQGQTAEVCNCNDDDCDGEIDEGSLCEGGACIACMCASPCAAGEFPCPPGRICDRSLAEPENNILGYCVLGQCAGVQCSEEEVCDPTNGECINLCIGIECTEGFTCIRGDCIEDNCYGRGCDAGQICQSEKCVTDPCADVSCDEKEYCSQGQCVAACPNACPRGQSCQQGECKPAPCGGCGTERSCIEGSCVINNCGGPCGNGRVCQGTACVDDPCANIDCPTGAVCSAGACSFNTAAAAPDWGLATGGGGSTCAVSKDASPASLWFLLVAGLLTLARRRRLGRVGFPWRALANAAAFAGLTVVGLGCSVDPYCFGDCPEGDGRIPPDGGVDPMCRPQNEVCNGRDDDCGGDIDEDWDLENDLANCGACGKMCSIPQAFPVCDEGVCKIGECEVGYHDLNGSVVDGCEYRCEPSGAELCDLIDNDCDGKVDEGFDLQNDLAHCGQCANTCQYQNAVATCVEGECAQGACNAGFVDVNGDSADGCEYACTPLGNETCNGVDDDCDTKIDEGFNPQTDPQNCGFCGRTCLFPAGVAGCDDGTCVLVGCQNGQVDLNNDPTDGCEFGCTLNGAETCNGQDDDCNGAVDDGLSPPATPPASCVKQQGVCAGRTATCRGAGGWACDYPATYQMIETICDGLDNDCDGTKDEGCLGPVGNDLRLDTQNAAGARNSSQLAVSGNGGDHVYASWISWDPPPDLTVPRPEGISRIFFSRTTDGGGSWGTPARLDTDDGPTFGPAIAVASGGLNVVWPDFRGGTNYREIYRARSTSSGNTFGSDARMNAGQNLDSFDVDVAASGSYVYAVYQVFTTSRSRHIFFVRSTNSGTSWSAPVQIDHGTGASFRAAEPQVVASGSDVHVIWRDNRGGGTDIFYSRSTDNGATFTASDQRLNTGVALGSVSAFDADIAVSGGNVYVVWVDNRTGDSFDIFLNRSTNRGASWLATPRDIDQDTLPHESIEPKVVTTVTDAVVVAWVDYRFGFPDILSAASVDAGTSFSAPVRVDTGRAPGATGSYDVAIAADGALVGVAWADDRSGLLDIYANFSLDGGLTYQPQDYRMDTNSAGAADSQRPHVWVASNRIHVLWEDNRAGVLADIRYNRLQ